VFFFFLPFSLFFTFDVLENKELIYFNNSNSTNQKQINKQSFFRFL